MQKLSVKYLQTEFSKPLKDYSPWSPLVQSQGGKFDLPKLISERCHLNRPRDRKAHDSLKRCSKGL